MKELDGISVLLADDDPILRSLAVSKLTPLGCSITETSDGDGAWAIASRTPFDLALLDLQMPGMNGFEVLSRLRRHPRTRHLPVIVITSREDEEAIMRAYANGATSFVTKPVNWLQFGYHLGYVMRNEAIARQHREALVKVSATNGLKDRLITLAETSFRAPLNEITVATDELEAALRDCDRALATKALIARIRSQSETLDGAVRRMMYCARSGARALNVAGTPHPVSEIVSDVLGTVEGLARGRGVSIKLMRPVPAIAVDCDREAIAKSYASVIARAIACVDKNASVQLVIDVGEKGELTLGAVHDLVDRRPDYFREFRSRPKFAHPEQNVKQNKTVDASRLMADFDISLARAVAESHEGRLCFSTEANSTQMIAVTLPPGRVNQLSGGTAEEADPESVSSGSRIETAS